MFLSRNSSVLVLLSILITLSLISTSARPLSQSPPPSVLKTTTNSAGESVAFQLAYDAFDNVLRLFNPDAVKNLPRYQRSRLREARMEAVGALEESRFSFIAPFLESHLMEFADQEHSVSWTVFAPDNDSLRRLSRNMDEYPEILMRHLVATKVSLNGIARKETRVELKKVEGRLRMFIKIQQVKDDTGDKGTPQVVKNVEGQSLVITTTQQERDDAVAMVNGLEITAPYLYYSKWIVVHGINGVISLPAVETEI